MVEVRLFATLRLDRGKILNIEWKEGITGIDILNYLSIDPIDIAIYLRNGRNGNMEDMLDEGDILSLFPPVGGG